MSEPNPIGRGTRKKLKQWVRGKQAISCNDQIRLRDLGLIEWTVDRFVGGCASYPALSEKGERVLKGGAQ